MGLRVKSNVPERKKRSRVCGALSVAMLAMLVCASHGSAQTKLTISAAASLKDALAETESVYKHLHPGAEFDNNFGSSGTLATQIDQGAPVDIFLSAAAKPMDDLEAKGLIVSVTRRNLLRNSLVLIAPLDSQLKDFQGLASSAISVIAIGDPASVPAGQYGKQTLTALRLFDVVKAKLVFGKDVRQVLTYVETGNADAGIVYATDARVSGKVRVVAAAPETTHDSIVYPAAVVTGSRNAENARLFLNYLSSPPARAVFQKYGFTIAAP